MRYSMDSAIMENAFSFWRDYGGNIIPLEFTGPYDEYMATRTTASLGIFLSSSPIYDITGPDAEKFLNYVCVNRDFSKMKVGGSRHGLLCNERGQLLGSGVVLKKADGFYRTYWLAPALQFFCEESDLNIQGRYCTDEYFYQIDGPKSLEILETATNTDLHDLKFGQHKDVMIEGTVMTVYRLGMSGALAYEMHGAAADAETAYKRLRKVLFDFGGKLQGARNYCAVNHTVAGYPNQYQHFWYPFFTSGEKLKAFAEKNFSCWCLYRGSASDDLENFYVTPYDLGWGKLVNFDKEDFRGREALLAVSQKEPRKMVTLEWNADDVADVFASQFRGTDSVVYDQIEHYNGLTDAAQGGSMRGDYVLCDGKKIGVATGKTYAWMERRMVSLASIDAEYAVEGKELIVLWGTPGGPMKEIRTKVAPFPYYQGEFRNETFDVEKIPRLAQK